MTRRVLDGLTQPVRRPAGGINDLPAEIGPLGRHHPAGRHTVNVGKYGAQRFVAGHHISQRRTQRVGIQAPLIRSAVAML